LKELVYFMPDIAGGITNVIKVLVNHHDIIVLSSHNGYNKNDIHAERYFNVQVDRFNYHISENIHHVCSRLFKHIPDNKSIIIANDWLELEMMARLGLANPVILILHGDYEYYYQTAVSYNSVIDKYIGVSERITTKLKEHLPERSNDISYMPIGVEVKGKRIEFLNRPLHIIFPARLVEGKGYLDIFKIDQILKERNVLVNWTIAGDTSIANTLYTASNFNYEGKLTHEHLLEVLTRHDIFILPSRNEGFPVSLLEAMKTGLVPLITNFKSGIPEVIINGETGFVFEVGDIEGYANVIESLHNNRGYFISIADAAYECLKHRFTPALQKEKFEEIIKSLDQIHYKKRRDKFSVHGSRLDNIIFPNTVVKFVRNNIKRKKNKEFI